MWELFVAQGASVALSATRVKAFKEPGRYSDGGGLHLYISRAGRKSWVLRITIDGRRRDIGLGGFPSVSLAGAREKAAEHRAAVAEGPRSSGRKVRACDADFQRSRLCRP